MPLFAVPELCQPYSPNRGILVEHTTSYEDNGFDRGGHNVTCWRGYTVMAY
jgi:hypothetical protein